MELDVGAHDIGAGLRGVTPTAPPTDITPDLVKAAFGGRSSSSPIVNAKPIFDFRDTEIAFRGVSDRELFWRDIFFSILAHPGLSKFGQTVMGKAVDWGIPGAETVVKKTAYSLFCGGETIEEALQTAKKLKARGQAAIVDYAVEGSKDEPSFEAACNETIRAIGLASEHRDAIPFVALKVTGLVAYDVLKAFQIQPGQDVITPTHDQTKSYEAFKSRLERIAKEAKEKGIFLFIDAEETQIQGSIDHLVLDLMRTYNRELPIVQTAVQLYRHDRLEDLRELIQTGEHEGFYVGLKLVRGAYMGKERRWAKEGGYEDPIHPTKVDTDSDFDTAVALCIENIDRVMICIATHNEKSCELATEAMARKGLQPNDPRVSFAQLLGMSDHISANLSEAGYNVCKYLPYGPWNVTFPYLARRITENSAEFGQKGTRESQLIKLERDRRELIHP